MTEGEPLLSVIFTTYTRQRLPDVRDLLAGLAGQTYRRLEPIFVGERDVTLCEVVAQEAWRIGLPLHTLFNEGKPGLSAARNRAIGQAKGDIIAFIDDDAIPFADWAEEMVRSYQQDEAVIGVSGAALPLWEDPSLAWFPEEFFWIISCTGWFSNQGMRPLRNTWGMNMSFRREAFAHGLFNEDAGGNMGAVDGTKLGLLGEDTEFSLRLVERTGRPLIYNPQARVFHKVYRYRLRPRFVRWRSFWEGYTKATLRRRYGNGGGRTAEMALSTEHALLRRIALRFFPRLVATALGNPGLAWRRLRLAADSLSHVALGYCSGLLPPLAKVTTRRFNR